MKKLMFASMLSFVALGASACGGGMEAEQESPVAERKDELLGSDACKNVDITVENSFEDYTRAAAILVRKFEFYSASEGRWLSEDVANREIAYGAKSTFWDQNLEYAENDTITAWRVYFSYRESDGQWSQTVYQQIDTPNDVCNADDNYYLLVN